MYFTYTDVLFLATARREKEIHNINSTFLLIFVLSLLKADMMERGGVGGMKYAAVIASVQGMWHFDNETQCKVTVKVTQIKSGVSFLIFCLHQSCSKLQRWRYFAFTHQSVKCFFVLLLSVIQPYISLFFLFKTFQPECRTFSLSHCCLSSRLKAKRQINSKQTAMLLSTGQFNYLINIQTHRLQFLYNNYKTSLNTSICTIQRW